MLRTTSESLGEIQTWFGACEANAPTVGVFLYITLASLAAGLTLSAIRWLVLDPIHHATGVQKPNWDFSKLGANLAAFEGAVQNHYRYYQFFGSMLLILVVAMVHFARMSATVGGRNYVAAGGALFLVLLFFIASRDALQKYYARTFELLGVTRSRKDPNHDERLASEED